MTWFLALAASDGFTTFRYTGRKKTVGKKFDFNARHVLEFLPGDDYAIKRTTRGPTAGSYQVKFAKAPHVTYRSVPATHIDKIVKESDEMEDLSIQRAAGRAPVTKIGDKPGGDKQKDLLYKPSGTIRETSTYDRDHYQWREVFSSTPLNVKTLKQGRMRAQLRNKELFGLRYVTKAKGGYVVLPDDQRINISHENFMELVDASRIVVPGRQRKGIVVLADVKAASGKKDRIIDRDAEGNVVRKIRNPKPADFEASNNRLSHDAKKSAKEDVEDWDEDFDDEQLATKISQRISQAKQPPAHKPKRLKVGSTIRAGRSLNSTFIIVEIEDLGKMEEFTLYNVATNKISRAKMAKDKDLSREADLAILEDATPSSLAAAQRALNKELAEEANKAKPRPKGRGR